MSVIYFPSVFDLNELARSLKKNQYIYRLEQKTDVTNYMSITRIGKKTQMIVCTTSC